MFYFYFAFAFSELIMFTVSFFNLFAIYFGERFYFFSLRHMFRVAVFLSI